MRVNILKQDRQRHLVLDETIQDIFCEIMNAKALCLCMKLLWMVTLPSPHCE